MSEKKTAHWTESLVDSVYGLYEAANEYRTAHRAAQLQAATVDRIRRMTYEGRIALEGRPTVSGRTFTRAPHGQALSVLSRLYGTVEAETQGRYEEAALLYASGAAWAVRAVLEGKEPPAVAFWTDDHGDPAPHSLEIPGLQTWADGPGLDAAYDALVRCTRAAEYTEELGDREPLNDHESAEIHRANTEAAGIADAAFAYGLLGQRAVSYALIGARRTRESELAQAHAAAQVTPAPPELPHAPYITAVIEALTAAGLEPDTWWTSDAETDPYATGDDAGCTTMLTAVLAWDDTRADEDDETGRDGLFLFWDHPAEQWQYARPRSQGGNTEPEFLPKLGLYSDPDAVASTTRALLANQPFPDGHAPYWHPAGAVRAAVTAWAEQPSEPSA
ncbi:hypothetical protein AB0L68_36405 [Streptomyces sp. NPDC052164]|uniref:hypothetical protein n=1 Tax=Streptomyces sp. NPDC052164 TaxID=3155529 RepID=UPI00341E3FD7